MNRKEIKSRIIEKLKEGNGLSRLGLAIFLDINRKKLYPALGELIKEKKVVTFTDECSGVRFRLK